MIVEKYEKSIIALSTLLAISDIFSVSSSIQSYKSRRLCNQFRKRFVDAENTNRKLIGTVEQCKDITKELGKSVDRNISSAREAIELV